jgi:hypothetical protein
MMLALVAACKPTVATKPPVAKVVQPVEPQWRHVHTDKQASRFATPAVQTVGPYKRIWVATLFAKPKRYTVGAEEGLVARSIQLSEFDCAETRVRDLQVTVYDEKEWSAAVPWTAKDKEWTYVNPDSKWMPLVRHVCRAEKMTDEGFSSVEAASAAYRKKLLKSTQN